MVATIVQSKELQNSALTTTGAVVSFDAPTQAGNVICVTTSAPDQNTDIVSGSFEGQGMTLAFLAEAEHARSAAGLYLEAAPAGTDVTLTVTVDGEHNVMLYELTDVSFQESATWSGVDTVTFHTQPPGFTHAGNCIIIAAFASTGSVSPVTPVNPLYTFDSTANRNWLGSTKPRLTSATNERIECGLGSNRTTQGGALLFIEGAGPPPTPSGVPFLALPF